MKFRTEIETPALCRQLDHATNIFMAGSCFADNISAKLRRARFRVECNPLGVLYNPLSIERMFDLIAGRIALSPDDMVCSGGAWFSYLAHSSLCGRSAREAADNIARAAARGAEALERAECVILTLGTTGVYRLAADGSVAANCHKQPADFFTSEHLDTRSCAAALRRIAAGPAAGKHIILTVSPVRYVKEGLAGSMLSKATLLVACHDIAREFADVDYFPAFEILNDDLRDYRFYGPDLVHPSAQAVEYVWEKFCETALTPRCRELLPRFERIAKAREHKPFDPDGEEYRSFLRTTARQVEALHLEVPSADLAEDLSFFGCGVG